MILTSPITHLLSWLFLLFSGHPSSSLYWLTHLGLIFACWDISLPSKKDTPLIFPTWVNGNSIHSIARRSSPVDSTSNAYGKSVHFTPSPLLLLPQAKPPLYFTSTLAMVSLLVSPFLISPCLHPTHPPISHRALTVISLKHKSNYVTPLFENKKSFPFELKTESKLLNVVYKSLWYPSPAHLSSLTFFHFPTSLSSLLPHSPSLNFLYGQDLPRFRFSIHTTQSPLHSLPPSHLTWSSVHQVGVEIVIF